MDIQTKTDIIHQKIYDFLLYIYPLLTKYPKYEKFSLQTATRNAILEMLQEVIKWDKTATKSHLYTVDTALQECKDGRNHRKGSIYHCGSESRTGRKCWLGTLEEWRRLDQLRLCHKISLSFRGWAVRCLPSIFLQFS